MAVSTYRGYSSVNRKGVNTALHGIDLIKADLANHVSTPLGTRPGRPRWGCVIHDMLFELFENDQTARNIVLSDIKRIIRSDPRVREVATVLVPDPDSHVIIVDSTCVEVETDMEFGFQVPIGG